MNIQQQDDGKNGSFFVQNEAEQVALMTYSWTAPNLFAIEHTEVKEALEGKGIARQLLQRAIEFAREKGCKIDPQCRFASAIIHKTPEYQDVLN